MSPRKSGKSPSPDGKSPPSRPGGNVRRPGGSDHPHDPRRPGPGAPKRDHDRPAGDEGVTPRNDDVPRVKPRSRAPLPGVPDVGAPEPVD